MVNAPCAREQAAREGKKCSLHMDSVRIIAVYCYVFLQFTMLVSVSDGQVGKYRLLAKLFLYAKKFDRRIMLN